jgi:hypothetical protein
MERIDGGTETLENRWMTRRFDRREKTTDGETRRDGNEGKGSGSRLGVVGGTRERETEDDDRGRLRGGRDRVEG